MNQSRNCWKDIAISSAKGRYVAGCDSDVIEVFLTLHIPSCMLLLFYLIQSRGDMTSISLNFFRARMHGTTSGKQLQRSSRHDIILVPVQAKKIPEVETIIE